MSDNNLCADSQACVGFIERRLVRRATSEPSTRGREGQHSRRGPVMTLSRVTCHES